MFSFKTTDGTLIRIILISFIFTLVFTNIISASQCCDNFTDINAVDTEWTVVLNYANIGTPHFGDNATTHCQCRQACLDLPGCTNYDWYPINYKYHCWIGNNCPVNLSYDINNQHYLLNSKRSCYSTLPDTELSWKLVMNNANTGAQKFGDNNTTHCQCRQACQDLANCTGYDWSPSSTSTRCWIGNNCPVTLTSKANNQHYIPTYKRSCYDPNVFGSAGSLLNSSNAIQVLLSVALLLIIKEILQIRIV